MEINSAENGGAVGNATLKRYLELARGGWGIVFLEATSVTKSHLARQHGLILSEKNLTGFKQLVKQFKSVDPDTLFMIQLTHSGRHSGEFSKKVKAYPDNVSEIPLLSEEELEKIRHLFIKKVALADEAGFDGVDIKACHGYLGGELLRPINQRKDRFGGSVENRAFLISSVIQEAVEKFPRLLVGSRFSAYEGIRGGCGTGGPGEILEDLDDIRKTVGCMVKAGAHYLNISSGIPALTPQITRPAKKGYFCRYSHFRYTKKFKEWFPETAVIGSTYTTGDLTSFTHAEENLVKGHTDFVGFGRQNLADAEFPKKVKEKVGSIHFCTFCGKCSKLLKNDQNVFCREYHKSSPYL